MVLEEKNEKCCGGFCTDEMNKDKAVLEFIQSKRNNKNSSQIMANCMNGRFISNCGLNKDDIINIICILNGKKLNRNTNRALLLSNLQTAMQSYINANVTYQNKGMMKKDEFENRWLENDTYLSKFIAWLKNETDEQKTNDLFKITVYPFEWEVLNKTEVENGVDIEDNMLSKLAFERYHTFDIEKGVELVTFEKLRKFYGQKKAEKIWTTCTLQKKDKYAPITVKVIEHLKSNIAKELYGLDFSHMFPVNAISQKYFDILFIGLKFVNDDDGIKTVQTYVTEFHNIAKNYKKNCIKQNAIYESEVLLSSPVTFPSLRFNDKEIVEGRTYNRFEIYPRMSPLSYKNLFLNIVNYVRKKMRLKSPSNIGVKQIQDGEAFAKKFNGYFNEQRNLAMSNRKYLSQDVHIMMEQKFVPLSDIYLSHGINENLFYQAIDTNLKRFISILKNKDEIKKLVKSIEFQGKIWITQKILQESKLFKLLSSVKPIELMPCGVIDIVTDNNTYKKLYTNNYYTMDGVGRSWALKKGLECIGMDIKNVYIEANVYCIPYRKWRRYMDMIHIMRGIDGVIDDANKGMIKVGKSTIDFKTLNSTSDFGTVYKEYSDLIIKINMINNIIVARRKTKSGNACKLIPSTGKCEGKKEGMKEKEKDKDIELYDDEKEIFKKLLQENNISIKNITCKCGFKKDADGEPDAEYPFAMVCDDKDVNNVVDGFDKSTEWRLCDNLDDDQYVSNQSIGIDEYAEYIKQLFISNRDIDDVMLDINKYVKDLYESNMKLNKKVRNWKYDWINNPLKGLKSMRNENKKEFENKFDNENKYSVKSKKEIPESYWNELSMNYQ